MPETGTPRRPGTANARPQPPAGSKSATTRDTPRTKQVCTALGEPVPMPASSMASITAPGHVVTEDDVEAYARHKKRLRHAKHVEENPEALAQQARIQELTDQLNQTVRQLLASHLAGQRLHIRPLQSRLCKKSGSQSGSPFTAVMESLPFSPAGPFIKLFHERSCSGSLENDSAIACRWPICTTATRIRRSSPGSVRVAHS